MCRRGIKMNIAMYGISVTKVINPNQLDFGETKWSYYLSGMHHNRITEKKHPGGRLSIKMSSNQYGDSRVKDIRRSHRPAYL